jgi:hypothetical protein
MSLLNRLSHFWWQVLTASILTAAVAICLLRSDITGADVAALDRSTYITTVATLASILSLFCSVSIAFVLFVMQAKKAERVAAYDQLKSRLLSFQQWLFSSPQSEDRETCLSLVFELEKYDLSDLPQTDRGKAFAEYARALQVGLDGDDADRRRFFLTSVMYSGYIEQLLNRIGMASIGLIVQQLFINTVAKGVGVICLSVGLITAATIWYGEDTKLGFVLGSTFCATSSVLLFVEFCNDLYRYYDEELDFIERHGRSLDPPA